MNTQFMNLMIFVPLVGAVLQALMMKGSRWVALSASWFSGILGMIIVGDFAGGVVHRTVFMWIAPYAVSYDVAVSGLNALPLLLVCLICPLVMTAIPQGTKNLRGMQGLFLLVQSCLVGIVCAQDLFLAFFFLALSGLLFYFLFSLWGEKKSRERAAFQFLITSGLSNVLIFVSMILIYFSVEPNSFSVTELMNAKMSDGQMEMFGRTFSVSRLAFYFLALGMVTRIPIWPVHGWFTSLVMSSPMSILVLFAGLFIPVLINFFMRTSYLLFPEEVSRYSSWLLIVGGMNALVGALISVSQSRLRPLFSHVVLIQSGLMLVGLGSLETSGVVGAIYQQATAGISMGGLGIFVGWVLDRLGDHSLDESGPGRHYGGLVGRTPILALFVAVICASLLGFPGAGGFVGVSLIMMGGYRVDPMLVLVLGLGMVLLTYSIFGAFRSIFLGEESAGAEKLRDFDFKDQLTTYPLVLAILFMGIYPKPLLDLIRPSVLEVLSRMGVN